MGLLGRYHSQKDWAFPEDKKAPDAEVVRDCMLGSLHDGDLMTWLDRTSGLTHSTPKPQSKTEADSEGNEFQISTDAVQFRIIRLPWHWENQWRWSCNCEGGLGVQEW